MDAKSEVIALLTQAQVLDPYADAQQIASLYARCLPLLDKAQRPRPYAYANALFADMIAPGDRLLACAAYTRALECLDPDQDQEAVLSCRGGLGVAMMTDSIGNPDVQDRAIEHLEAAVSGDPVFAPALALLYSYRFRGDRHHNWTRRMACLELALSQIDRQSEPEAWARCNNEIALACVAEPNGDYAAHVEQRIKMHIECLEALKDLRTRAWIRTQIWLSEAWASRVHGEREANLAMSAQCADEALRACTPDTDTETHRMALQAVARASCVDKERVEPEQAARAMLLLDRALALFDPEQHPQTCADIERSRALVLLKLVQSGQTHRIDELVACTRRAMQLLEGISPSAALVLGRIEADARILVGDAVGAIEPLEALVSAGHEMLAQSHSLAGRLETVQSLGDGAALLCYAHIAGGDLQAALSALEKGKGLFWAGGNDGSATQQIDRLIPPGGALLFACFAGPTGYVIIVTESALRAVPLPRMGRAELMKLQRGEPDAKILGGWLFDYGIGSDEPDHWHQAILTMGQTLYDSIWAPLLEQFKALKIDEGAELVWFHQGGSAVFPIHAAWTESDSGRQWLLDRYALRYAPSLQALLIGMASQPVSDRLLVVSDPTQDLATEALESVAAGKASAALGVSVTVALEGQQATRERVLEELAQAKVAHFSTHALPDFEDPWRSYLFLAGTDRLTLLDCLEGVRKASPKLVSLSACDSGRTRVSSIADEFIGFPAAFLYAGTQTVYATLWRANDWASGLITRQFYLELAQGVSPVQALRRAQIWLREISNGELSACLKEIKDAGGADAAAAASMRTKVRGRPADERPFEHPYYWGPFTVSGS